MQEEGQPLVSAMMSTMPWPFFLLTLFQSLIPTCVNASRKFFRALRCSM